jgi:hypothetical protein
MAQELQNTFRDEDNQRRQLESQEKAKFGCFICNLVDEKTMLEYHESQVCQNCDIKLCVQCGFKQFINNRNGNRCPNCREVFGDRFLGIQIPSEITGRNYEFDENDLDWDIQGAFAELDL